MGKSEINVTVLSVGSPASTSTLRPSRTQVAVFSTYAVVALLIFLSYRLNSSHGPDAVLFPIGNTDGPSDLRRTILEQAQVCDNVVEWQLDWIRAQGELAVHVFKHDGTPLGKDHGELDSDASAKPVCVVVAVPQTPAFVYTDIPVRGKGPDDVHLYVNSTSGIAIDFLPLEPFRDATTRAVLEEYWHACSEGGVMIAEDANAFAERYACWQDFYGGMAAANTTILYSAGATFIHHGTYEIYAEVENAHYTWAHQWVDNFDHQVTRYPTGLQVPITVDFDGRVDQLKQHSDLTHMVQVVPNHHKHPRDISVEASPTLLDAWNDRPYCDNVEDAGHGRWISEIYFPGYPVDMYDEWGMAWDGDFCKIDWYSQQDFVDCLDGKDMYMYGDSNMRRISKSLVGGNTYCRDPTDYCQHGDLGAYTSLYYNSTGDLDVEVKPFWNGVSSNHEFGPIKWGRSATIHFGFLRDLAFHWHDWTRRLYASVDSPTDDGEEDHTVYVGADARPFNAAIDLASDAVPRHDPRLATPDVVVIGAPYWDMAFDAHITDFGSVMPHFAAAVMAAYPNTHLIIKVSQGYCCRPWRQEYRRFSGQRLTLFNEMFVNAFRPAIAVGKATVLDPRLLTGRPEAIADYEPGRASHARYSRIRVETQMLLNAACAREDGPGTASPPRLKKLRHDW